MSDAVTNTHCLVEIIYLQEEVKLMSKIMTFEEIQQNYDGEWVLIVYTEADENLQVVKGEVIAHSVNKEEVDRALESVQDRPLAIEYMGKVPEDIAFIL
jgi:hypothetical protein